MVDHNFIHGLKNGIKIKALNVGYPETAKYQIDVFDLELLQDILAACINEKWQENEPYVDKYGFFNGGKNSVNINNICGKNVAETDAIRPTIEQICEEHGYMLDGPNIIKKTLKNDK